MQQPASTVLRRKRADTQTERQRHKETETETPRDRDTDTEKETWRERETDTQKSNSRENSNSKTLFYQDCSLDSVKNLSNN